jgi:hypothetical protein
MVTLNRVTERRPEMAGRGRPFVVAWKDEDIEAVLRAAYRAERDVDVRQRLQLVREWRSLPLVVDPLQGRLWWFWSHTMQATVARTLVEATKAETDLATLVWDRAPSHRDATVQAVGLPLIGQPPYSPELNPAKRVFEQLRAGIEGSVCPTIEDKVAAVGAILADLDADPGCVKLLTGWLWITDALHALPQDHAA